MAEADRPIGMRPSTGAPIRAARMGCESWIEVERDTQTHAILSARLPLSQEEEE